MRLGINAVPHHDSPQEWGDKVLEMGFRASCFPVKYHAPVSLIDAYVREAKARDIVIAEVGVWDSPYQSDPEKARQAAITCEEQLRLADYVQARCCVNVSGSVGEKWSWCYAGNFGENMFRRNVDFLQNLLSKVNPQHTCYALEPMQWMVPDSPAQYDRLLKEVDHPHLAVHMDFVNYIKDPYTYTHQQALMDEAFSLLGSRIVSCHLKDCVLQPMNTVSIVEVLPGQGATDMAAHLTAIDRLGGDMPVLLEHLHGMDEYRQAAEYVRSLGFFDRNGYGTKR